MDHTDLDHCFALLWVYFIITTMAPVIEQPGEGPLHGPAAREYLKARAHFVHDRQGDLMGRLHPPDPLPQPRGPIAAIDPEPAQAFEPRGPIALDQDHQPYAVIGAGRGHHHRQDQSEGIDPHMALAPLDLLVAVEAHRAPLCRRLNALAIDAAGRGLGLAPLAPALQAPQRRHQPSPYPCPPPTFEIGVNRAPLAEVLGHPAPLTTSLEEVQNPIKDAPPVTRRTPRAAGAPFAGRQQG